MIRCAECHEYIVPGEEVDHGFRTGPDGQEVERPVCKECDEAIRDAAMVCLP